MTLVAGCPAPDRDIRQWQVMGTTACVRWSDTRDFPVYTAAEDAQEAFAAVEKLLNRFDPGSELNRLAKLSDAEILEKCDPRVRPCYEAAFKLRDQSGGAFDPRWRGAGTLDLGAIAKGFAVDLALAAWDDCDVKEYWRILVDLGGNLKAAGTAGWKVGIAGSSETLTLTNGMACATSAEYFRGKHIIDARTGNAVTNDLHSVTVIHPSSAMLADGLSTVCFILGKADGEAFLRRHHPEAYAIWINKTKE